MIPVDAEFEKIAGSRAVWRELGGRGKLRASGVDRVRFLDGMLTNDVADLGPGRCCYAALLNRKGRILADLNAIALEGEILLDTAPGTGPSVAETLEKFIIADDVTLEDLTDRWAHFAIEGPDAASAAGGAAAGLPGGRVAQEQREGETLLWLGGGELTAGGVQLMGPRFAVEAAVAALGLPELAPEAAEILRVEAFLPRYGVDMSERNLLPETRLEHAVDYAKGCYIGQEIVARIRSRGRVNRLLVKLRTADLVHPEAPIHADGKAVGEVTSAVLSPCSGPLALGYVRREHARPGSRLEVEGADAEVLHPPLESD